MVRSILLRAALSGAAVLAVAIPAAQLLAQAPAPTAPTAMNPWVNLAPFPTPSEEVLGATANDKLYVFAGLCAGLEAESDGAGVRPGVHQLGAEEADAARLASRRLRVAGQQDLCVRRIQAAGAGAAGVGADRQCVGIRPRRRHLEGAGADADQ